MALPLQTASRSSPPADVAWERSIESHLPLVEAIVRRYAEMPEDLEDLVRVGAVGLIRAAERFEPSENGVVFATFAAPAIEDEIRRHLLHRRLSPRISRSRDREADRVSQEPAGSDKPRPSRELAVDLVADEHDVERELAAAFAGPDDNAALAPRAAGLRAGNGERHSLARSVLALDEAERRVVYLRFYIGMNERQIARALGTSPTQVTRRRRSARAQLRKMLAAGPLPSPQAGNGVPGGDRARGGTAGRGAPSATVRSRPPRGKHAERRSEATSERPAGSALARPAEPSHVIPTPARFVELPYQIAVRSESTGDRSSWKATIEELPDCEARAGTADEAVRLLRPAMEQWLASAVAEGREIPLPNGTPRGPSLALSNQAARARALRITLAANLVTVVFTALVAIVVLVLALQRGI